MTYKNVLLLRHHLVLLFYIVVWLQNVNDLWRQSERVFKKNKI